MGEGSHRVAVSAKIRVQGPFVRSDVDPGMGTEERGPQVERVESPAQIL